MHSTTEKSSNSKGKHHTDKELSSLANGALGKSAGVHKIPVEERAAIQIQTTYRAYKVCLLSVSGLKIDILPKFITPISLILPTFKYICGLDLVVSQE